MKKSKKQQIKDIVNEQLMDEEYLSSELASLDSEWDDFREESIRETMKQVREIQEEEYKEEVYFRMTNL